MLIRIYSFILFISLVYISPSTIAQNVSETNKTVKIDSLAQDSIFRKYWNLSIAYPLFSQHHEQYIDSILYYMPKNSFLNQQKAMALFKQMKYGIGMPYLDTAVLVNRRDYLPYRAFIKCIFAKDYTGSIIDFKNYLNEFGETFFMDHPCAFYISLSFLQQNKFDSALAYMNRCNAFEKKSFKNNPIHFLHQFYMGIIFYETGKYDEAIGCFNASLSQYPTFSDAIYYRSLCMEELHFYKEALEEALKGFESFKKGNTINEDNAIYENYPYQVKSFLFENSIKRVQKKIQTK